MSASTRAARSANARALRQLARHLRLDIKSALHWVTVEPFADVWFVADALEEQLAGEGIQVWDVDLEPETTAPITALLEAAPEICRASPEHPVQEGDDRWAIFIFGLPHLLRSDNPSRPSVLFNLNAERDRLRKLRVPTIFWVDPPTLDLISSSLPDLWNWSTSVTRLSGAGELPAPEPEAAVTPADRLDAHRDLLSRWLRRRFPTLDDRVAAQLLEDTVREFEAPPQAAKAEEDPLAAVRRRARRSAQAEVQRRADRGGATTEGASLEPAPTASGNASQARAYYRAGESALQRQQLTQAESQFRRALQLFRELGDRVFETRTLQRLGSVATDLRRLEEAEQYYRQALRIYSELNDSAGQASTLHTLGILAQERQQRDEPEVYYQQALAIRRELNDRYGQASLLHNLGTVAEERRQWEEAEAYYQEALAIRREFNDRSGQAGTLHQLGRLAQARREWPQARQYLLQALEMEAADDDQEALDSTLASLARLWKASDDASLPAAVAAVLGRSVPEVERRFRSLTMSKQRESGRKKRGGHTPR